MEEALPKHQKDSLQMKTFHKHNILSVPPSGVITGAIKLLICMK